MQPKPKTKNLKIVVGFALVFTSLAVLIIFLGYKNVVSIQLMLLMLIALIGFYVGFGILIASYRFIRTLNLVEAKSSSAVIASFITSFSSFWYSMSVK